MKRIKGLSKLLFIFILAVFSISVVKAAGVTVSTTSIEVRQGNSTSFNIYIEGGAGRIDVNSSDTGVATVSANKVFLDSMLGNTTSVITVTGISEGSTVINVISADVSDDYGNEIRNNYQIRVKVTTPSGNSALSALSVSNCSISFNPSVTDYDCGDLTDYGSVRISATAADASSSISGAGTRTLSYGNRTLSVTVTAESGAQTTYNIRYRKDDNRSSIATLDSLSVVGYDINFKTDFSGPYTITVPYKIDSVTIEGVATDPATSRVSGLGTFPLDNIGENRFEISVTAENGVVITYVIIVMRSDVANEPSTTLIKLSVNDSLVDLTGNATTFLVGVDNNVNELALDYETISNTTTYQVTGNENLKDGINVVTIKVSDSGKSTSTYVLIVNKAKTNSNVVSNLNNIKDFNKDVTYNTLKYQNPVIDEGVIKLLKDSSNNLIYNVTNENKGLLYSITFNNNSDLSGALEPFFSRVSGGEVTYATNLPADSHIKLYADNNFENGQEVKVYSYDESSKQYKLVTTAKVEDYYLEFDLDGASKYVLSTNELKSSKVGGKINIFNIILIILVILSVGFIVLLVLKNKKLAANGPAITSSTSNSIGISTKETKQTSNKKEEKNKKEEIVPDFKPIEPSKGLYGTMDKGISVKGNNQFAENSVKDDIVPINLTPSKGDDSLINKDINKYSSLEAEIKKNMLDEEKEKKDISPITPLKDEDSKLSSYTIDLTSIDEEIKRHQFEEDVFNKAHGVDGKVSKPSLKKEDKDAIVLPTIDEEIAKHNNESKTVDEKSKSSGEIDDFSKKKDKDILKVIDSEPYPNSKPKQKKLSDTAILPIIDENGEVKKNKDDEDDF